MNFPIALLIYTHLLRVFNAPHKTSPVTIDTKDVSFRSVAVITFASHAKGPQFEPGRKHNILQYRASLMVD